MKRKTKRWLWITPLLLLGALAAWGAYQVDRIQDRADRLAATGTGAIKLLGELGAGLKHHDLERVAACYDEAYDHPQQALWNQRDASHKDGVTVYRWQAEDAVAPDKEAAVGQMARLLENVESFELAKLKLARVEEIQGEEGAVVRSVLWLRGQRPGGELFESQATLRFHLRRATEGGVGGWSIARQELVSGTTTEGVGEGFADIAEAAGITHRSQPNPLFATDEWFPETFEIIQYGPAGVSAADVDGDGWADLFFGDGVHPRLYMNRGLDEAGELRFEDVSAAAGLPADAPGSNVGLFADLDNDGDDDLVLPRFMGGHLLFRNEGVDEAGVPRFTDLSNEVDLGKGFVVVASAADYDNDGDLDLYLGRYLDPRTQLPTTLFYTRNGQGNSLLRNDGVDEAGVPRFTDVTEEAGVREGGLTLGVAWADYDADGDQDLYVSNDFGRNALLRNEGPDEGGVVRFADVSEETGTLDFGFGMSTAWGDADADGDLDLYVSNVHSGQRWYGQATTLRQYLLTSLRQGTFSEDLPLYQEIYGYAGTDWQDYGDGMVKGNSLMINDGEGAFTEVSEIAGTNPFGWYWGSAFVDYDNDGWQDVYANNGWITGRTYDDL
ncbi:MAG: VCBS repeat-containing protein [Acidobacteriota bacterium]|nr:VCBS repeat-containing protein [Acidobacteriota bacterium]